VASKNARHPEGISGIPLCCDDTYRSPRGINRSPEECPAEGRQQKRQDRRSQIARTATGWAASPVYHDDAGVRTLRELARTYLTMTKDVTPVMNRRKAVYRSWPFLVPVSKFTPHDIAVSG
jgi:hypothetical protein